jgi:hypothetical protein
MNWLNIFGLALATVVVAFMLLRVERRAVWLVVFVLLLPGALAIAVWATLFRHWPETLLGVGLGLAATLAWWLAAGRRLPRPTSDSIAVWGQEKVPRPSAQQAAEMQAEMRRLQAERDRLEAEVRRLKGEGPAGGNGTAQG